MPDDTPQLTEAQTAAANTADKAAKAQATAEKAQAAVTDEQAPAYGWLRWQGPAYYGGVPTRGSGPNGELTPQETETWLGSRPGLYEQAIHTDKSYVKIAAPKVPKAGKE